MSTIVHTTHPRLWNLLTSVVLLSAVSVCTAHMSSAQVYDEIGGPPPPSGATVGGGTSGGTTGEVGNTAPVTVVVGGGSSGSGAGHVGGGTPQGLLVTGGSPGASGDAIGGGIGHGDGNPGNDISDNPPTPPQGGSGQGVRAGGGTLMDTETPTDVTFFIDGDNAVTSNREVRLRLTAHDRTTLTMRVSENENFAGATWRAHERTFAWMLPPMDGVHRLYAQVQDDFGNVSAVVSDDILLARAGTPLVDEPQGAVLGVASFRFTRDIVQNEESSEVRELQRRLRAEGFFAYPTDTGRFGAVTEDAVKAYQHAHGIAPTGFVGPLTRAALNAEPSAALSVVPGMNSFIRQLVGLSILPREAGERTLAALGVMW